MRETKLPAEGEEVEREDEGSKVDEDGMGGLNDDKKIDEHRK